ncbi:hypothetical protein B0T22DRAFT_223856 [Podospora appendiculata]|uniref:Myb-like domain-containing protein n=1 Tax=Podospora appendiculata TaxID=314037 RepID=A0AAE1CAJ4_9PEZI|nr:hypothetical protein B0T22DRAFT_223856 [Podospora appendiculata]
MPKSYGAYARPATIDDVIAGTAKVSVLNTIAGINPFVMKSNARVSKTVNPDPESDGQDEDQEEDQDEDGSSYSIKDSDSDQKTQFQVVFRHTKARPARSKGTKTKYSPVCLKKTTPCLKTLESSRRVQCLKTVGASPRTDESDSDSESEEEEENDHSTDYDSADSESSHPAKTQKIMRKKTAKKSVSRKTAAKQTTSKKNTSKKTVAKKVTSRKVQSKKCKTSKKEQQFDTEDDTSSSAERASDESEKSEDAEEPSEEKSEVDTGVQQPATKTKTSLRGRYIQSSTLTPPTAPPKTARNMPIPRTSDNDKPTEGFTPSQGAIIQAMRGGQEPWEAISYAFGRSNEDVARRYRELSGARQNPVMQTVSRPIKRPATSFTPPPPSQASRQKKGQVCRQRPGS